MNNTIVSKECLIRENSFQLLLNMQSEFPYIFDKLRFYKCANMMLIVESASRVRSELDVLIDNVISKKMWIDMAHLELLIERLEILNNMLKNSLGQSVFKVWLLIGGYIADLHLVKGILDRRQSMLMYD